MFKSSREIPFAFTKPASELAPAFLADGEEVFYEQGFRKNEAQLVDCMERFLRLHGLSHLRLVAKGAENLVFASVDAQRRRRVVFKVNYTYGLTAFAEAYKQVGEEAKSLNMARRTTRFEEHRQRGAWQRLRRSFPQAIIPTYHLSTYELPVPGDVLSEIWDASSAHNRQMFPGAKGETTLPVLVMQQRMTDQSRPKGDRVEVGMTAIWLRDDARDPLVHDLARVSEETDGVLLHQNPTTKSAERLLAPLFPEMVRFQQELIGKPEEWVQIQALLTALDAYVQKTRTAFDLVGSNNINFLSDVRPDGGRTWKLEFVDPFVPKISSYSPAPTIDVLQELFMWAKNAPRWLSQSQRLTIQTGIIAYYQLLALKAWCQLFKVASTVTVPGIETVTTQELRILFWKAVPRLCI